MLDEKLGEDTDIFTKLGVFDTLQSLVKKKEIYNIITSQKSVQILMKHLISKNKETIRFIYLLLIELIDCYEKHERLEKKINIDTLFEDDMLLEENSGSLDMKKSKNSKNN